MTTATSGRPDATPPSFQEGTSVLTRRRELLGAAAFALVIDGLIVARSVPHRLGVGPDGVDFLRVSRQPFFSGRFWASTRAPVLPFLLWLLGHSLYLVRLAQPLLSFAAWALLAIVVAARMRTAVGRVAVYIAVLLLSATFPVTIWYGLLLSESLSMSLMVGWIAVLIVAMGRWSRVDVAFVTVGGLLFVFVRDTNALIGLTAAAVLAYAMARRRVPLRVGVVVAVLVVASVTAMVTASSGGRSMQSLHQVVRDRVLESRSATAWFEDRGLPDVALVRSPAGDDLARHGKMWREPRFARYRHWLRTRAQLALATYIVRHPSFLQEGPYTPPSSWAGPNPSVTKTFLMFVGTSPPLGATLDRISWPESPWVVFPLEVAAVALGTATILFDRRRRMLAALGVTGIVIGMASVIIAANLATQETPRHAIVPMAMARLGIIAAFGAGLEWAATSLRHGRARSPRQP